MPKSILALDVCLAMAGRAKAPDATFVAGPLGGNVPPEGGGAAIFITLEDSAAEVHRRAASLDPKGTREGAPIFVIPALELDAFDPILVTEERRLASLTRFAMTGLTDLIDKVAAECPGQPPRLLVLDPAGDFIAGDEDSANFVKPLMRRLREIARSRNITILLLGHVAKSLDPAAPTMRGSGAWISNARFAYALMPATATKARNGKVVRPAPGMVIGTLIKANHRGAPVGRPNRFRMDGSGRLVAADDDAPFPGDGGQGDPLASLIEAGGTAHDGDRTLTRTGPNGLYERRTELPECLTGLSKRRLWELADQAIADGWIVRLDDGCLLPADAEDGDGDE